MLNAFKLNYIKADTEVKNFLGVTSLEKYGKESSYYTICEISDYDWELLQMLSYYYDLDSPNNDFYKFNHNSHFLQMYNPERSNMGNTFLFYVYKLEQNNSTIKLGWKIPSSSDRKYLKEKVIFDAKQTKEYFLEVLIPKAQKMYKEGKFSQKEKSFFDFIKSK